MTPRSYQRFDWTKNDKPHWLVTSNEWRDVIRLKKLEPGSDLFAAYLEEVLAVHREGWRFHEFTMRFAGCIGHKENGQGIIRIDLLDQRSTNTGAAKRRLVRHDEEDLVAREVVKIRVGRQAATRSPTAPELAAATQA